MDLVKNCRQMIQLQTTHSYTYISNKQATSTGKTEIRTISLLQFILIRYKLVFAPQSDFGHPFTAASHTH